MTGPAKSKQGFAAMDPLRQRELASMGGRAAHEQGTAHEFNSHTAKEAGRKGGLAAKARREKAKLAATPPEPSYTPRKVHPLKG